MDNKFIITEMEMLRKYCSAILKEREKIHNSLKYPLISVKINRYFLEPYREVIAEECNIIGYMDIPPVEYYEEVDPYELSGKIEILLDNTKSDWQEELYQKRLAKREENEKKKLLENNK